MHQKREQTSDLTVGVFLISLGSLLLLDRLGYPIVSPFLAALGVTLILLGFKAFLSPVRGIMRITGLLFFLIGAIFVTNGTGLTQITLRPLFNLAWPFVLVALGFLLITSRDAKEHRVTFIGDVRFPSDADQMVTDRTIWVVISDIKIDLPHSAIPEGATRIALHGIIGDISITLPADVEADVRSSILLGDINLFDRRFSGFMQSAGCRSENFDAHPRKVIIDTSLMIGDIKIRSV